MTDMTSPWHPYRLIQPADRSNYEVLIEGLARAAWPEFMLHDPVADRLWDDLYTRFAAFQFALLAPDADVVVGMGNSVALAWHGDLADLPEHGWDWAFEQAVADRRGPCPHCAVRTANRPARPCRGAASVG